MNKDKKPCKLSSEVEPELCLDDCVNCEAVKEARLSLSNEDVLYHATQIFDALSDLTRFRILASLATTDLCVCDLQEICGVSQSAISHQLRLLRDRKLVTSRREGKKAVYSLVDDHVRSLIDQGLAHASHAYQEER